MEPNATLPLINTIGTSVGWVVNLVKVLIGGVFGVYLVILYLRWKEYRMMRKEMKALKHELVEVNKKLDIISKKWTSKKK